MSLETIQDAFGVRIRTKRTLTGKKEILPPPPNVLRVLGNLDWFEQQQLPGHGPKTQKRRSKRRRLRLRDLTLQRQTWRAFGEAEKRTAAGMVKRNGKWVNTKGATA